MFYWLNRNHVKNIRYQTNVNGCYQFILIMSTRVICTKNFRFNRFLAFWFNRTIGIASNFRVFFRKKLDPDAYGSLAIKAMTNNNFFFFWKYGILRVVRTETRKLNFVWNCWSTTDGIFFVPFTVVTAAFGARRVTTGTGKSINAAPTSYK